MYCKGYKLFFFVVVVLSYCCVFVSWPKLLYRQGDRRMPITPESLTELPNTGWLLFRGWEKTHMGTCVSTERICQVSKRLVLGEKSAQWKHLTFSNLSLSTRQTFPVWWKENTASTEPAPGGSQQPSWSLTPWNPQHIHFQEIFKSPGVITGIIVQVQCCHLELANPFLNTETSKLICKGNTEEW